MKRIRLWDLKPPQKLKLSDFNPCCSTNLKTWDCYCSWGCTMCWALFECRTCNNKFSREQANKLMAKIVHTVECDDFRYGPNGNIPKEKADTSECICGANPLNYKDLR